MIYDVFRLYMKVHGPISTDGHDFAIMASDVKPLLAKRR